jgi:Family of unknown function (DUF5681)
MSNPGQKHPPTCGQFRKGQSGNPKGRPTSPKPTAGSAYDIIIDKTLTVTQGGLPREVTVEEALQHRTYQDAVAGSRSARREILKMIAKREKYLAAQQDRRPRRIEQRIEPHDPENAEAAMLILGIADHDPTRRGLAEEGVLLEPWAVQAALSRRRGGPELTDREVSEIRRCTRNPDTLRWPRGVRE